MPEGRRGTRRSKEGGSPGNSPLSKRALHSPSLKGGACLQRISDLLDALEDVVQEEPEKAQPTAVKASTTADIVGNGVGFGGTHADEQTLAALKTNVSSVQARQDQALLDIFRPLLVAIQELEGLEGDEGLLATFLESSLPGAICDLLRNGSLLDVGHRAPLYIPLLDLIVAIWRHPLLAPLLKASSEAVDSSAVELLHVLDQQSQFLFKSLPTSSQEDEVFLMVARSIHNAYEMMAPGESPGPAAGAGEALVPMEDTTHAEYVAMFRQECFQQVDIKQAGAHYYLLQAQKGAPVGRAIRKRMMELAALPSSLPCNWDGSIAVRMDEADSSLLKILIVGPTDTPYANGCFVFDMSLPPTYPAEPPKVHLVTTQPSTRLNPNLYADGSVCLSLLGTWAGPGWIADTSTILQVLVSIHALIFVSEPYFNEPGYEVRKGTAAGDVATMEYNQRIRMYSAKLAILDQLRAPSPCFASLIRRHFLLKRAEVLQQLMEWQPRMAEHSFSSQGRVEHWKPAEVVADIRAELDKLAV